MMVRIAVALFCCTAAFMTLDPLLVTRLKPATLQDFAEYSRDVKSDVERRMKATPVDFVIGTSPALTEVMNGRCIVGPSTRQNPVAITEGLIHDWTGDIFIPHATARDVLGPLQDFNHHSQIYPAMIKTRLLHRSGNHFSGYWRLSRDSNLVKVTLDLYEDADYLSPAPGKWLCEAHTPKIIQIDAAGTPQEKALPDGVGYGFLWRMDSFWLLEERNGGVLAECRSLSLSRGIPAAVAWMIKPYVDSQPRDAMQSTLESTRAAVERLTARH
jgi:hypothetical protein